jgi:site-specific DNA-methyltransferase (adenine-specific)
VTRVPPSRTSTSRGRLEYLYSSATDEWATPRQFFDLLDAEFHFTLDPCATPENAKAPRFFTRESDRLKHSWPGSVFMNPPYGRDIPKWMAKAYLESRRGSLVVCLIPARTDTRYWHEFVMHADEIRFVRGRLRFEGGAHSAPFPSVVVVFRPGRDGPRASQL